MIDLIIPTYNDKEELIKTLNSIPNEDFLKITVVDDGSFPEYDKEIKQLFQNVNFIRTPINGGPGRARQFGIDNTKESHIMFIDSGDLLINNINFYQTINNFPDIFLFIWNFLDEQTNKVSEQTNNHLHGKIYSRFFLNKFDINFNQQGSYYNQDIGFNRLIRLLLNQNEYMLFKQPLILKTLNVNSTTCRNYHQNFYKKQNQGLAINEIYVFNKAKINNVSKQKLQEQADKIIVTLYSNVYKTAQKRPQFLNNSWAGAKLFYSKVYYEYDNDSKKRVMLFSIIIKDLQKQKYTKKIPFNLKRFLNDLKNSQNPPSYLI